MRAAPALLTACILLFAGSLPSPATDKCGVVCNETWTAAGNPFVVTCDVSVPQGCTLTVEAGVEVRFQADTSMLIPGHLDVNGTPSAAVVFTSDAALPQRSDWVALAFISAGTGEIDNAVVRYSADGVYVRNSSSVTITDSTLTDNGLGVAVIQDAQVTMTGVVSRLNFRGLHIFDGDSTVVASGCTFNDNLSYGIYINGNANHNPSLTVTGSTIYNPAAPDLYSASFGDPDGQVVDARGNWWGTTDPTEIIGGIRDHRSLDHAPLVDWCDYLDGPSGQPALDSHCPEFVVCDGTTVWDLADKPYLVTSDVVVCPTGTLRIERGVEVRPVAAYDGPEFQVGGRLEAIGTRAEPVTFTSESPAPSASDWAGLTFEPGTTGEIEHASIRYAESGVRLGGNTTVTLADVTLEHNTTGALLTQDDELTMTGVTARFNENGLRVDLGHRATVRASGCAFTDNSNRGVLANGSWSSITITRSSIHSNLGSWDLSVHSHSDPETAILWATDCWWGTTDVDAIRERIGDHEDWPTSPRVYFRPFGGLCDVALGEDRDGDGLGDIEDNCPAQANADQADADADRMGDLCDPQPAVVPTAACDGNQDDIDGYADSDGDGWGDPCDFHPGRADSYPGAVELCDGRDNDGDDLFALGELSDGDLDRGLTCGDCDDVDPAIHVCACERCDNLRDDDCDGAVDGDQAVCVEHPSCVHVTPGSPEPSLHVDRGGCGAGSPAGPFEVVRGEAAQLEIVGGSVDLGQVDCVDGNLAWDRVTELSPDPDPPCTGSTFYYLARDVGASDFGSATGGEPRNVMSPDPPCP